ncbi:hypothetical protein AAY72_01710 [Alishewanella sp. WH16-1]|uniref:hypothetical protein n=1 Tax=Alishewanella sp. WH16-1 TaxID=1651088 RepID=UPI00070A80F9|nr:hypothetical protein [Alishewanella sp. WH16-1]KRS22851.1 hypothetical protein AAY72_01710 [Alishewanella sp. WH16-1]
MLSLIQQPTSDTCTSACLAMLTGIPVDKVINEFHQGYFNRDLNPCDYLAIKGIQHTVNSNPYNNNCDWGCAYLVAVPSLNIEAGMHNIIIDCTGDEIAILDPCKGRDGKKHYINWTQEPTGNEVNLKIWMVELAVPKAALHQFKDGK